MTGASQQSSRLKRLVAVCLQRPRVDKLELVERLTDVEGCRPGMMLHLQHPVEHVRGHHGAPFGRRDLQSMLRGLPHALAQPERQLLERTLTEGVSDRFEVNAELLLTGEARVREAGVVQVMRETRQKAASRIGVVIGRQQDGIDRYDKAVVTVALGRFQL